MHLNVVIKDVSLLGPWAMVLVFNTMDKLFSCLRHSNNLSIVLLL